MSNITQVINVDKNMTTLKKAVHASDLDQLLSSTGPFTFFAPSDLAFAKLEKSHIDHLLSAESKVELTDLLNDHLVNGKIFFKDLKDGDKLTTVNGKELLVQVKEGKVRIGEANIYARDAKITNGTILMMDMVMPKN